MIIYGNQNVVVPENCNFGKYVLDHFRSMQNDNVCMENGITRETLTYKECTKYTVNLSVAFSKLGIKKGDVVAIGADTFLHYVPTVLAAACVGAAYTTYDVMTGRAILKHKLELVKPKYFICSSAFWEKYKETLHSFSCIDTYIAIDDIPELELSLKDLMSKNADVETFEPVEVDGKTDVVLILYSSGTTGMPKGVQQTHYSCIATCMPESFKNMTSLHTAFMSLALSGNLFHFMTYKFLLLGRKVVFSTIFTPETAVKILRDCQVDIVFATPLIIHRYMKCGLPIETYWDSVKIIYCRSFPLRAETTKRFKESVPKAEIIQAFGLTECGEPFSQIWTKNKPGSVGIAAPGIIAKVVDVESRAVLGPDQPGEICVKGLTIMKGYYDIDRYNYLDEDGFYKTGDLGYYDSEKHFYIIDRITDIISTGGFKISPVQIETVLLQHPAVLDAGVIGKQVLLEKEIIGRVPMAFVVKKPGCEVSDIELKEFVAAEVTWWMKLEGGILFISEIPRNLRGKILRRKLRELLDEHSQKNERK